MNKTMSILMFSSEYDKALQALILANSAKEMNIDTTIFFAFWGLLLIRDPNKIKENDKSPYKKIFTNMTPKDIEDFPLSKNDFPELNKKIFMKMMEENHTPTLTDFLNRAIHKGIKLKACKLSCEIMGLKENELIDEVEIITMKDYLKEALDSDIQLFIWVSNHVILSSLILNNYIYLN